jgi:hypothetical protein
MLWLKAARTDLCGPEGEPMELRPSAFEGRECDLSKMEMSVLLAAETNSKVSVS